MTDYSKLLVPPPESRSVEYQISSPEFRRRVRKAIKARLKLWRSLELDASRRMALEEVRRCSMVATVVEEILKEVMGIKTKERRTYGRVRKTAGLSDPAGQ
jgi:hypothetical protein